MIMQVMTMMMAMIVMLTDNHHPPPTPLPQPQCTHLVAMLIKIMEATRLSHLRLKRQIWHQLGENRMMGMTRWWGWESYRVRVRMMTGVTGVMGVTGFTGVTGVIGVTGWCEWQGWQGDRGDRDEGGCECHRGDGTGVMRVGWRGDRGNRVTGLTGVMGLITGGDETGEGEET